MQTSKFQIGLIAALSLCLGLALSSGRAIGYPVSGAVSYAANPVVSFGGGVHHGETLTVLTAPADQDLVLTDAVLVSSTDTRCKRVHRSNLELPASGVLVARFETNSPVLDTYGNGAPADPGSEGAYHFRSGIRVPAGESLTIAVSQTWENGGSCSGSTSSYGVNYTLSGYLAQP